jgi:hypothetical protein
MLPNALLVKAAGRATSSDSVRVPSAWVERIRRGPVRACVSAAFEACGAIGLRLVKRLMLEQRARLAFAWHCVGALASRSGTAARRVGERVSIRRSHGAAKEVELRQVHHPQEP